MSEYQNEIEALYRKLGELAQQQASFTAEIDNLRKKLDLLQASSGIPQAKTQDPIPVRPAQEAAIPNVSSSSIQAKPITPPSKHVTSPRNGNLEKFIGENLINKIGILITVIGVGIGAKYAIDHNLISPVTRIILGYLIGGGLFALSLRLRKKYSDFSAVLLSGSMAIFYCISYLAYAFYGLFPNSIAFVLMVLFTGFTVSSAIKYNKQVIAHIGLVGAYAVPFLLNEGSGRIWIFFSYISIINIGILVISLKKYWKPLFFVTFACTWIIFISWFSLQYRDHLHFGMTAFFLLVFFLIFYITSLLYKLLRQESFDLAGIAMIFLNAFIFYGAGCILLDRHADMQGYKGLFTLFNALIHFTVSLALYKKKMADTHLIQLSVALTLIFVTIAIPIQLDGDYITIAWTLEALILFVAGRTRQIHILEWASFPVMLLAFISMCFHSVLTYIHYPEFLQYNKPPHFTPLLNIHFLTAAFLAAALFFIRRLSKNKQFAPAPYKNPTLIPITVNLVYILLLATVFFAFRLEITHFWNERYYASTLLTNSGGSGDPVLKSLGNISNILFACIFAGTIAFSRRRTQNPENFNLLLFAASLFVIFAFLVIGLYEINFLQLEYLRQGQDQFYRGSWLVGIRYISFAALAFIIFQLIHFVKAQKLPQQFRIISEYTMHTAIVWCASAELVNWMHIINSAQSYKLGLSILWGIYALLLIVIGIRHKKSYLRIGAFSLFGITLIKLFFYDISHLNTISKTIVFVSLGILLLIISFLYNKYKDSMFDIPDKQDEQS